MSNNLDKTGLKRNGRINPLKRPWNFEALPINMANLGSTGSL